ncbi:MAG: c-type cytochrome [Verrucomicrobia bacterium]|nr:c-type cytochrome [Verrucomicrobiota bacterium]
MHAARLQFSIVTAACAWALSGHGQTPVPTCPPDWKLELVAAAPKIRHPSVVACAPDGRVFVAEDPMDISAPSANLALGRIICLHPGGRATVFADQLYAVFGLQYLEGKLYVLHNPKFSVFTDDHGVGRDRVDLIESTNPNPWALDWNDHVPANFRLAMDGYFYVAVGDKGLYGAVGKDGKRIDLYGGGILRLRPEATQLEVYSTGVRNILDVAVNAEDDLFTYDNTDEQQWMSRLTHMVDGGFYGYPYDFIPQQPYTLWMMADYGGGAATGALAYNEDALPSEYHGNLFLADFGKRQLLRVRIARDGGSYRAESRQDFFTNVPEDFRPVGIALAPDGLSIYICDWNHRDTKAKVEAGRLFKLSYTGPSRAAPRPDWFLPAAMGQGCSASFDELIKALAHPAQSVRLTAQRQISAKVGQASSLSERSDATDRLSRLLTDPAAPTHARWHALWTLDAIDGGLAARAAVVTAVKDRDPSVRRQAIRQLGTRRVREAAALLAEQLKDADASIRFQAATALGRLGTPSAVPALLDALDERDLFARYAAFTALNRIGGAAPSAWNAIVTGLESAKPRVREGVTSAFRDTYDATLVSILAKLVREATKPAPAREAALRVLASWHRQRPPWKGEWWAYHPVNAPPPQKTIDWAGTPTILAALREGLQEADRSVRLASLQGILEAKDTAAAPRLRELFQKEKDPEIKRELLAAFGALKDNAATKLIRNVLSLSDAALLAGAISAAEQIGGDELSEALTKFLQTNPSDRALLLKTLQALGNLKVSQARDAIAAHATSRDAAIRRQAFDALVKLGPGVALSQFPALLDHPSLAVRRSAMLALGATKSAEAVPHLLRAYSVNETRDEAISALASIPDARALDAYWAGLLAKDALLRQKCRKALQEIRQTAIPEIERRLDGMTPDIVAELQSTYRGDAEALKSRLFSVPVKKPQPSEYLDFAFKTGGDAQNGRQVFADLGRTACVKCHAVGREGGNVGPDLSTIGSQFSRRELAESILFPSKAVREGYQQVIVETKDDESFSGLVNAETAEVLVLRDGEGNLHRIPKARLQSRRASALSLMPEGLHEVLTPSEFADLVAFLESLKDDARKSGREK